MRIEVPLSKVHIHRTGIRLYRSDSPITLIQPICLPFTPADSLDKLKVLDKKGRIVLDIKEGRGFEVHVDAPILLAAKWAGEKTSWELGAYIASCADYDDAPTIARRHTFPTSLRGTSVVDYYRVLMDMGPEEIWYTNSSVSFVFKDIIVMERESSPITRVFVRPTNIAPLITFTEFKATHYLEQYRTALGFIYSTSHSMPASWGGLIKTIMEDAAEGKFRSRFDELLTLAKIGGEEHAT